MKTVRHFYLGSKDWVYKTVKIVNLYDFETSWDFTIFTAMEET